MRTDRWHDQSDRTESVWTRDEASGTQVAIRKLTKEDASVTKLVKLRRIKHNTTEPGVSLVFERTSSPKVDGTPRKSSDRDGTLSFSEEETRVLLTFLQEAEVFRMKGAKEAFKSASLEDIWSALLQRASSSELLDLKAILDDGPEVPEVISITIEHHRRAKAIERLRELIEANSVEHDFQVWFEANPWVFQADAIKCLDDRRIDVQHIADLLITSIDGCVDVVELKRPSGKFWSPTRDHDNLVPHSELISALTQVWNYQAHLENQMDRKSVSKRLNGATILRPQATLILGRSVHWSPEHLEAQRLLNSSLHGVTVMTYDQALERAERINRLSITSRSVRLSGEGEVDDPFDD